MLLLSSISADRLTALILIVGFTAYGVHGSALESSLGVDVVGPDFYPKAIAVFGVFLSFLLLIRRPAEMARAAGEQIDRRREFGAMVPLGMMLVYVLSLDFLGFPIATFLFLVVVVRYLGCPSWLGALVFGLLSTVAAVLLFRYGLVLRLPRGDLIWFW